LSGPLSGPNKTSPREGQLPPGPFPGFPKKDEEKLQYHGDSGDTSLPEEKVRVNSSFLDLPPLSCHLHTVTE
jgi:hypothetical protein